MQPSARGFFKLTQRAAPAFPRRGVQVLEAAEVAYHHADVAPRQPSDNELVPVVYARWVGDVPGSAGARERLHTHYRHRPKALAGEAGAEGAAVVAPTRLAADW